MLHLRNRLVSKGLIILLAIAFVIAGCAQGAGNNTSGNQPSGSEGQGTSSSAPSTEAPKETPYLELWGVNLYKLGVEKDHPYSQEIVDDIGIGYYSPFVAWEGGTAYYQRLSTKIASGEMPDIFLPWNGIEATLIQQGALADLTDLLPVHAPNIWNRVPKEIWDVVRTADPTGEGRIYYIPKVDTFTNYGAFIRKDWLDHLGLEVPQTKEEFDAVLQAFLDEDANGNGDPNDEIPISGREFGRWMDVLFGMYGVAMWEGLPMWDVYDGELTYSAVTPNMRAAIENARDMYAKKLLDNETFLNKNDDWRGKMASDRLGSWFHINTFVSSRAKEISPNNPNVELVALPVPKVEGYDGFITMTQMNRPEYVIANKSEENTINALKLLDWAHDPANQEKLLYGIEGINYVVENGKKVAIPTDYDKHPTRILSNNVNDADSIAARFAIELEGAAEEDKRFFEMRDKAFQENQKYGKPIAGDGMPATVYEGFPDIMNHTLYQEVMTKIIIGDQPIEAFDAFVEEWYKSGGQEVTDRAREWYAKVQAMKDK